MEEHMRNYDHEPIVPYVNYLDLISNKGSRVDKLEYPLHVREDKILNSGEDYVLTKVSNTKGDILHVVLISSFDGIHWFCWIIEYQKFDIMETGRQWEDGK